MLGGLYKVCGLEVMRQFEALLVRIGKELSLKKRADPAGQPSCNY
ncbi:hypothetical protein HMPREF1152_0535 [Mogibacterium sp. CM50]|nr:hypothetical protein HMPREF1152_0535 [Mogibacterium sp. CM50]